MKQQSHSSLKLKSQPSKRRKALKTVADFEQEYASSKDGQARYSAMARVYEHLEQTKRQTLSLIHI